MHPNRRKVGVLWNDALIATARSTPVENAIDNQLAIADTVLKRCSFLITELMKS
jgi:hypothetical protein